MATGQGVLTKTFLEDVLKSYLKIPVTVDEFAISTMMLMGVGYSGDFLKIRIKHRVKSCNEFQEFSIVAKCFPEDEAAQNIAKSSKSFEQELQIYAELVPAINCLENRRKFCPDPIYITSKPMPMLLLEDLTELGYKVQPRELGLDLEHCLLVVAKLAYFHASSVAVYEKNQEIIKKYNTGLYFKNPMLIHQLPMCFQSILEACQRRPDFQQYAQKLKTLQETIAQKVFAVRKPNDGFNILNHGDFWIANLMFTYTEDKKPSDVAFVDFQYPIYSSPALDLHFFWATSIDPGVREKHMHVIFQHYFKELLSNLSKLDVRTHPPTYEELLDDFRSRAIYGFAVVFMSLPLVKATKRKDSTIGDYFGVNGGEGSFRFHCFNNERYLEDLQYFLPFYDSLGMFQ